jgi:hypothetical protein
VQGVQVVHVVVGGPLVQVAEVLHGGHAALGRLLWDVQLLDEAQLAGSLVGELVRDAVVALGQGPSIGWLDSCYMNSIVKDTQRSSFH